MEVYYHNEKVVYNVTKSLYPNEKVYAIMKKCTPKFSTL